MILVGVLRALRERGVAVGRDVALLGTDDIEIAQLHAPPISVLARDLAFLSEAAARLLVESIQRHQTRIVTLPTYLIARESTAIAVEPIPALSPGAGALTR